MSLVPYEQLKWSDPRSSLLAGICIVTGFVNVWRFPELMAMHGGEAFLLAYAGSLLILALPVVWLQWQLGRRFKGTQVGSLVRLGQVRYFSLWQFSGGMMILACGLTAGFYILVSGVTLAYLLKAALGVFNQVSLASSTRVMSELQQDAPQLIAWFTICLVFLFLVSAKGLIRGLQRSLPLLVGALIILAVLLAGYGALNAGWKTTWELLFRGEQSTWGYRLMLDALTQAFFSMALSTGVYFILGAYCCREDSPLRLVGKILLADLVTGLAATLIVVPIVLASDLQVSGGFALVFQTLPVAFQALPLGQLWLALFYVLFILVALTSLLFLLEPAVYWYQLHFRTRRRPALLVVLSGLGLFAALLAHSMVAEDGATVLGMPWFTFMQFAVSVVLLPLSLLFVLVLMGYVLPREHLAAGIGLAEGSFYFQALYRWIRYVLVPLVFLILIYSLLGLLQYMCFLGEPYNGSICPVL